uniref:Uncharacterized protein n=1 Tax=Arundo donax TaxID=35708 RepID=A0A0A9FVE0_ARUDO
MMALHGHLQHSGYSKTALKQNSLQYNHEFVQRKALCSYEEWYIFHLLQLKLFVLRDKL